MKLEVRERLEKILTYYAKINFTKYCLMTKTSLDNDYQQDILLRSLILVKEK